MRYILLATWVYVNGSTGTAVSTQFSELHYSLEACDQERRLLAKMGIFARCKPETSELPRHDKLRARRAFYFAGSLGGPRGDLSLYDAPTHSGRHSGGTRP